MYIVKVLKRKDAASLVVAIIVATSVAQSLYLPVFQLSNKIAQLGANNPNNYGAYGGSWRDQYLSPLVSLVLQLLALEILLRLFILIHPLFVRKK